MENKEICKKMMDLNEKIVIVGPPLGKDTDKEKEKETKLRVYYKGGLLAKIDIDGKIELMDEGYAKNIYCSNPEKLKEFIANPTIETISNSLFLNLAEEAFDRRWKKEAERNVETQIVRKHMLTDEEWMIIDMEFQCPPSWFNNIDSDNELKNIENKTDREKFDLISFSKEGIGIIELKVNNKHCDNICSHYAHMKHILNNKESKTKFINEIHRRIDYLQKNELINSKIIDKYSDQIFNEEKLWCGFLFVGGGKSGSAKIVKELGNKEFTDNLKFMYCDFNEIDSLNINNMQNYTEFLTITFEQIEQRLKNKPKEQCTKDDVFDRYVGYGSPEEIENPEVQKLFIKHGLFDELINLVNNVITDKEVIEKILKSNIFKKNELKKIRGKIKDINISEIEDDKIDELKQISIIFEKENNTEQLLIKDFCLTSEIDKYLQDKNKYKNKMIMTIIEEDKNELILKCFCNLTD